MDGGVLVDASRLLFRCPAGLLAGGPALLLVSVVRAFSLPCLIARV